ncbi:MAG: hypothetical protein EBZ59_08625, partial [Planctomycetia bacterium]|nr:hypothetical protein [Planctomycetia bacterium]
MSGDRMMLAPGVEGVPIVHCHVPRTGGLSVDYFFREIFGDDACVRLGSQEDFERLADPQAAFHRFQWRYLSAHLPARLIMDIVGGRKIFLFTIVRDPVERELSAFQNIVDRGYAEHQPAVRTFDDYLDLKERSGERNVQCGFIQIGSEPAATVSAELLQYLAAGHSILSLGRIFLLQEYMRAALGCQYIIESQNASTSPVALTDSQRRRLAPLIDRDLELFNLVCSAEKTGN